MASVHPRGCGEHDFVKRRKAAINGSSPRVRGTPKIADFSIEEVRFIPAGAGNTSQLRSTTTRTAVHPRGCGEHFRAQPLRQTDGGSSPRVRGTRNYAASANGLFRFIPAGAGNTGPEYSSRSIRPVHPRGCGEHRHDTPPVNLWFGSSPRVRGTQSNRDRGDNWPRFIPAGAGNTEGERDGTPRRSVHPRGCGEHGSLLWFGLLR